MSVSPEYLQYLLSLDPRARQMSGATGLGAVPPPIQQPGLAQPPAAPQRGIGGFFGRLRDQLLPVPSEVANQLDPGTLKALRNQAVLQAGLGMLSAADKGAGFGTGAAFGYGQAQDALNTGLGRAYTAMRNQRQDEALTEAQRRTDLAEARQEQRFQEQLKRYDVTDARQAARDKAADEHWQAQYELDLKRLEAAVGNNAIDNARLMAEQTARDEERRTGLRLKAQDMKERVAVMATGDALGKYEAARNAGGGVGVGDAWRPAPGKPTYGELKAQFFTYTNKPWQPNGTGLDIGGLSLPAAAPAAGAPPAPTGAIPTVATPEEAAKLPSGSQFRTPDGRLMRVP